MINAISAITPCAIRTILYGCESCSLEENKIVFDHVHSYMKSSNRFWWNGCAHWLIEVESAYMRREQQGSILYNCFSLDQCHAHLLNQPTYVNLFIDIDSA